MGDRPRQHKGCIVAVRLADYYSGHLRRIKVMSVLMLLAVNVSLAILFANLGFSAYVYLLFILMPLIGLQAFALVMILRYALEPLEILTRAITHTSSQANDTTPPTINEPRHEKTGLKQMVQTVYDNAASVQPPERGDTPTSALPLPVLDQFPCGIICLDAKRKIVFANGQAPVFTAPDGSQHIELLFKDDDSFDTWLERSERDKVTDGRIWTRIQNRLPDNPGRLLFDVAAHYQKDGAGGIETTLICINRSEHYAADEEDMDFIALAAHELRGPITVIRGYLDVLQQELNPSLQPDQHELFDRLNVSANRLSGYVSNILNVARYDRRHLKLHLREDRLDAVYATIADDLQLRARTQQRLLSVTIPADLPTIAADRASLSEVLANLVDNALKYSRDGGQVVVTATADQNFVTCSVQDFGMGIPSSVVGNLFSKFYRSHRSRQTVAGTGLGLYISKGIIESHGGQIGVRSTEGQGSIFTFSVPIYATVADKLLAGNNENKGIIESSSGWIKNHSMFRG